MAARLRSERPSLKTVAGKPVQAGGSGEYRGVDARSPGFARRKPRTQHSLDITREQFGNHPRDAEYVATPVQLRVKLARWQDNAAKRRK